MTSSQTNPKSLEADNSIGVMRGPQRETARAGQRAHTLSVDYSLTRRALGLAIGSLLLAGCFSLLLMVGRMPVFSAWVSDPLFFKRCLVLHVDLALIVWFFSFAAALYSLLPGDRSSHTAYRAGFACMLAWCAAAFVMLAFTRESRCRPWASP